MIRLEYQILAAVLLDLLLGDPRALPHPVRMIGTFAARCETLFRSCFVTPRLAGILTVAVVVAATGLGTALLLKAAGLLHPLLEDCAAIFFLYTSIAIRDLIRHSTAVYDALRARDLPLARARVAMIVGRDTKSLNETGISRATVESIAESMVDGITAPLFFAVFGGPVGAMLYKAINTGDSMFGYRNERYLEFGWAAARLDDLANFIPARLTAVLVPLAAALLQLNGKNAWRILKRDRFNHASPNSGHTEAAVVGALGIRLGGPGSYFGSRVEKPFIGDADKTVTASMIPETNRLMLTTSALFLGLLLLCFLLLPDILGLP